jgi:hypothetical protein
VKPDCSQTGTHLEIRHEEIALEATVVELRFTGMER